MRLLETAKSVDALLITLNEKCRKDVIDKMPENIKCISTFSIGFDHIDLEACKARGIKVGNAPHGVTVGDGRNRHAAAARFGAARVGR